MTKKPIIGISLDMPKNSDKYSYSQVPWYALRADYSDAVTANGGIPILLPFDEEGIDEVLALVDGLIIPGGDVDIDPKFYGQKIASDTVLINHQRTEYDIGLMKKALEKDMPVLGICYGMQLMNVIFGGSLIQDLPTFKPSSINHIQPHPKNAPWHDIEITGGTKLTSIAGSTRSWKVNSTHHQAVSILGDNMVISAKALDGVIEAIESTAHKFALGVEWHPEYQGNQLDIGIFKALVDAARVIG